MSLVRRATTLSCFTPGVTLATFLVELLFVIGAVARYRLLPFGRLVTILLALLGTFQLAEYALCSGRDHEFWMLVAWIAITCMPAICLHLVALATGRWMASAYCWYGGGLASIAILLRTPQVVGAATCTGRFVALSATQAFGTMYAAYYMSGLLLSVGLLVTGLARRIGHRPLLVWILVGYCVFLVPMTVIALVVAVSWTSVPSIMCGFAVLYAIVLSVRVLPIAAQQGLVMRR